MAAKSELRCGYSGSGMLQMAVCPRLAGVLKALSAAGRSNCPLMLFMILSHRRWNVGDNRVSVSKTEIGKPRVIVGPAAERPAELAIGLGDRVLVDAGDAAAHQSVGVEFPVLVAVSAEPGAAVVMELVGEAHGDAVAREGPKLLDQPVVQLPRPFALEKRLDLCAPVDELGTVAPPAVGRVGEGDFGRVTAVPGVLGEADLLDRARFSEGRQRRTHRQFSRANGRIGL